MMDDNDSKKTESGSDFASFQIGNAQFISTVRAEDEDDWVADIKRTVCQFHQEFPELHYSGCSYTTIYTRRRATKEEREQNRKQRQERETRVAEARRKYGW